MTATEASLNAMLSAIWQIRRDRQEAAREQAIRDTIALEDDRLRWEQWSPVVQRSSGRADYEHAEVV